MHIATGSKPRMGFHMVNLLRRLADVFRMDAMDMNALTGKAYTECFVLAIGCRRASNVDNPV